jgi:CHAT domain-containing protein
MSATSIHLRCPFFRAFVVAAVLLNVQSASLSTAERQADRNRTNPEQSQQQRDRDVLLQESITLRADDKLGEALDRVTRAWNIETKLLFGRRYWDTDTIERYLRLLVEADRTDEAQARSSDFVELSTKEYGEGNWRTHHLRRIADDIRVSSTWSAEERERNRAIGKTAAQILLLNSQNKVDQALQLAGDLLRLRRELWGPKHSDYGISLFSHGVLHQRLGRKGEAQNFFLEAIQIWQRSYGDEHPRIALCSYRLGLVQIALRKQTEAESNFKRSAKMYASTIGQQSPQYINCVEQLAELYAATERHDEALRHFHERLELETKIHGKESRRFAMASERLSRYLLTDLEKHDDALPYALMAAAAYEKNGGKEQIGYLLCVHELAQIYDGKHEYALSFPYWTESCGVARKVLGDESPHLIAMLRGKLSCAHQLAQIYDRKHEYASSLPYWTESCRIARNVPDEKTSRLVTMLRGKGAAHENLGQGNEAVQTLNEALKSHRSNIDNDDIVSAEILEQLGRVHHLHLRDTNTAIKLHKQSMKIRKEIQGEKHVTYTKGLRLLANYHRGRSVPKAVAAGEKLVSLSREVNGLGSDEYAEDVRFLSRVYRESGAAKKAADLLRSYLQSTRGKERPRKIVSVTLLLELAEVQIQQGDVKAVKDATTKAQRFREDPSVNQGRQYAEVLESLSSIQHDLGDYDNAKATIRELVSLEKRLLKSEPERLALTLRSIGLGNVASGDLILAKECFSEALRIWHELHGDRDVRCATVLHALGGVLRIHGQHVEARDAFMEAFEIRKQLDQTNEDFRTSLHAIGSINLDLGDFRRAEPLLQRSREIESQFLMGARPTFAFTLQSLASMYTGIGDWDRAAKYYQDAVEEAEAHYGFGSATHSATLTSLGLLHAQLGHLDDAARVFGRLVEIGRSTRRSRPGWHAMNQAVLAFVYQLQRKYEPAESLLTEALGAIPEAKHLHAKSVCLALLGGLYRETGQFERASSSLEEALRLLESVVGEEHYTCAEFVQSMAALKFLDRNHLESQRLYRRALGLRSKFLNESFDSLSDRQQFVALRSVQRNLDPILSLSEVDTETAYGHVLAWKGMAFERQRRRRTTANSEDTENRRTLQALSAYISSLLRNPPADMTSAAFEALLRDLTERKERLETQMGSELDRIPVANIDSAKVRDSLADGTVFVDFMEYNHAVPNADRSDLIGKRRIAAFVLKKGADIARVDLGLETDIRSAVRAWRTIMVGDKSHQDDSESGDILKIEEPGRRLRQLLWDPLEKYISGATVLLYSPDGELGRFPLAALPGSIENTYLIEEMAVAVIPLPRDIPALLAEVTSEKPDVRPNLVVVGDVNYEALPGGSVTFEGVLDTPEIRITNPGVGVAAANSPMNVSRLETSGPEIDVIAELWGQTHVGDGLFPLRDADATEEDLRAVSGKADFLHFATHAFFDEKRFESALQRSDARRVMMPISGETLLPGGLEGWHPGLLSGITMTGANIGPNSDGELTDDGVLTSQEVAELALDRTDLVVISACESGLGPPNGGEGLLGLQRSFQISGARSVVASLWKMESEPTRLIMTRFYRNLWQHDMPTLEALRQAQLSILNERVGPSAELAPVETVNNSSRSTVIRWAPKLWAGWVLSGDPGDLSAVAVHHEQAQLATGPGIADTDETVVKATNLMGIPFFVAAAAIAIIVIVCVYRRRRASKHS